MITASKMFAPSKRFAPSTMFKRAWTAGGVVAETIQQLLQRNNGSGWWLGNSLAGLYQNSNLTTPVTAVGQVVGFMPDGVIGYVVGNTLLEGIASIGGRTMLGDAIIGSVIDNTISISTNLSGAGSKFDIYSCGAYGGCGVFINTQRMRFTFDVTGVGVCNAEVWRSNSGSVFASKSNIGAGSHYLDLIISSTVDHYIRFILPNNNTSLTFSNFKVANILGNHATQSTTANKPLVALAAKTLGEQEFVTNGTFGASLAGWLQQTPTGYSVASWDNGRVRVDYQSTGNAARTVTQVLTGLTPLKTYQFSAYFDNSLIPFTGSNFGCVVYARNTGGGTGNSIKLGFRGTSTILFTQPAGVTTRELWIRSDVNLDVANQGGFYADNATVREVLETSYALKYNGTSNFLTTSCTAGGATNFTLTVAGFNVGTNKVAAGCMSAVAESRACIGTNNSGNAGAGATTITFDTLASNQAWSSYHVVTLRRSGALLELFVDGVLADTETGTLTGTDLAMYLGALNNNGTAANFWQGDIAFTSGCLAVVNNADRLAIERYAGSLVGITI